MKGCLITPPLSHVPSRTPVSVPRVLPRGPGDPSLSKRGPRAPHSAPSGSLGSSKPPQSPGWSRPAIGAPLGAAANGGGVWRGGGLGGEGGLFVVLAALMSQAPQGQRKEESGYSRDGQRGRQPERTLQPQGIVAGLAAAERAGKAAAEARSARRPGRTLGGRSALSARGRLRRM